MASASEKTLTLDGASNGSTSTSGVRDSTIDSFLSLDESGQRDLLRSISPEHKQALLSGLKRRTERMTPPEGSTTAPVPVPPMSQSLPGNLYGGLEELGNRTYEAGKGLINTAADIGAFPLLPPKEQFHQATSAIKGIVAPVAKELMSPDNPSWPYSVPITAAGGDPRAMEQFTESGDYARAAAAGLGIPAITAGITKGLKLLPKFAETSEPITPNRSNVSALESQISTGVRPGKFPRDVAAEAQPLFQQAAYELGLHKPGAGGFDQSFPMREHAPQSDITGDITRGNRRALDIANKAVEIAERPMDEAIKVYGPRQLPQVQKSIITTLTHAADSFKNMDQPLYTAMLRVIDDVKKRGGTVAGLDELKKHANKEVAALNNASVGKQISASAQSAYAYQVLGNAIREELYPAIQQLGGPDLAKFGRREASVIQARDGLMDNFYKTAAAQANREAQGYLKYVANGPLYERHIWARMLGMFLKPGAEFNQRFRQGLGEIGRDYVPEAVTTRSVPVPPPPGFNKPVPQGTTVTGGPPPNFTVDVWDANPGTKKSSTLLKRGAVAGATVTASRNQKKDQ